MNSHDSKRYANLMNTHANIIAELQELSDKTSHFDELRAMLPLLSDLKKTESHNKEMNNILDVINKALTEIELSRGSNNKVVSNYSTTLDRMKSQTTSEVDKIQASIQELKNKEHYSEQNVVSMIRKEVNQAKEQIENTIDKNYRKIKEYIQKQESAFSSTSLKQQKEQIIKQKLRNTSNMNHKLQKCQSIFGELTCQATYLKQTERQEKDFEENLELFVQKCDKKFKRQVIFVMEKLRELDSLKTVNHYEQRVFCQYYTWGTRLKISLESAIIKLSMDIKKLEPRQNWNQKLAEWEILHTQMKQLLK